MAFIDRDSAGKKKSYSEMAVLVFLKLLKAGSISMVVKDSKQKPSIKICVE